MTNTLKNFAYSTVSTAPSPAGTGTSLVVSAGEGARFPAPPFQATIWPTGVQPIPPNAEVVTVTNVVTDTFTIVRAREGSTARSVIVGDQIAAIITAKVVDWSPVDRRPVETVVIKDGHSLDVPRLLEVPLGVVIDIGADGILEIS